MNPYTLRPVEPRDIDTLWEALTWAATMEGDRDEAARRARADPFLSTYVAAWGRAGDDGLIAEDHDGAPAGAVWVRLNAPGEHHPLHVSTAAIPELAIAVFPGHRGEGLGERLMQAQIARARAARRPALALSVRASNPATRLYARLGFVVVSEVINRVGGVSWTMRLDLTPP